MHMQLAPALVVTPGAVGLVCGIPKHARCGVIAQLKQRLQTFVLLPQAFVGEIFRQPLQEPTEEWQLVEPVHH
jgi:hypothetical protein